MGKISGGTTSPVALVHSLRSCSALRASHLWPTRISCIASSASFWTWKRSTVLLALRNSMTAMFFIEYERSIVISLTMSRLSPGMLSRAALTTSALVPETMAASAPFPPRASLFVRTVYSSPSLRAVSSMLMFGPTFSGNTSHSSACGRASQPK